MIWTMRHPRATLDMLGYIPKFLSEADPRPAREQINTNYVGGWNPLAGFTLSLRGLLYPGDPPITLIAETRLRDEVVQFYDCSWVAIIQRDGSFEVARLD